MAIANFTRTSNDLIGQKFNRLTVVSKAPSKSECAYWNCVCDCGGVAVTRTYALRSGKAKSCGCLHREKHIATMTKHGMCPRGAASGAYKAWQAMKSRCNNPNTLHFDRYGGRGITVCDRWQGENGFENFYADMGDRPEGLTIDRIDNSKGYFPENCVWASRKQQARNISTNRMITAFGRTMCLPEWADETGVSKKAIEKRLRLGWLPEKAVTPR